MFMSLLCLWCAEEPGRYASLIEELERQWRSDLESKTIGEATSATMPFLSLFKM